MVSLASLLAGIIAIDPEEDTIISGISLDSRMVKPGDLFVAYPGEISDGRDFIESAIASGAVAVLKEGSLHSEGKKTHGGTDYFSFSIPQLQQKISHIAARFYEHPSRRLNITGITGTNGKTSIAYLLACMINLLESKETCTYMGTLGTGFPQQLQESSHTTEDAINLQKTLAQYLKKGITHVSMEVSSHALAQGRVARVEFDTAVFTNLTRDHLDYHETMEAYGAAKAQLFQQFGLKSAIINKDDAFGAQLAESLPPSIFTLQYSLKDEKADLYANEVVITDHGTEMFVRTPWGEGKIKTSLLGEFNVSNLLAVLGVLGTSYPFEKVLTCVEKLSPVPGRLQHIYNPNRLKGPWCLVDYAHTPDALENALLTAKKIAQEKQSELWCVFGCGGDRDAGKRPLMGAIAEKFADHIVITNDNPRTESPTVIIQDILQGMTGQHPDVQVVLDRREAITKAFNTSENSIILIAGKGHEPYQIIGNEKFEFSDIDVCRSLTEF